VIIRKSTEEIGTMARGGGVVAETLALLEEQIQPGITTAELDEIAEEFGRDRRGDWKRAQGLARAQRAALIDRYGDLHARSHGESFLHVFQKRFVPDGLYLLDEPETALSPQRQLAFLAMLKDLEAHGAQFVIATHSPILLAYPGARIYSFDSVPVSEVAYEELDHVVLTRDFLNDPARYLRRLE
jgi:predicted ATPase